MEELLFKHRDSIEILTELITLCVLLCARKCIHPFFWNCVFTNITCSTIFALFKNTFINNPQIGTIAIRLIITIDIFITLLCGAFLLRYYFKNVWPILIPIVYFLLQITNLFTYSIPLSINSSISECLLIIYTLAIFFFLLKNPRKELIKTIEFKLFIVFIAIHFIFSVLNFHLYFLDYSKREVKIALNLIYDYLWPIGLLCISYMAIRTALKVRHKKGIVDPLTNLS